MLAISHKQYLLWDVDFGKRVHDDKCTNDPPETGNKIQCYMLSRVYRLFNDQNVSHSVHSNVPQAYLDQSNYLTA